jgi:hypothetical protein
MSEPNQFRQYQIVQDPDGNNVELTRNTEQVAVLAFDTLRLDFVHCHVLLNPLPSQAAFDIACKTLQKSGHPLLARMVDFGVDEGNAFYITGNVDGETLRGYLARQTEIPVWLAVMIACRSLEAAMSVGERGDFLMDQPMECLRVVQVSPQAVLVMASDFRVIDTTSGKGARNRLVKSNFERQSKFLKTFLQEQSGGGPTAPETLLPAADFCELLGGCLLALGPNLAGPVRELRNALLKFAPEHVTGEIPTAQKPRALVAPLLASYQEVARGVVNLVRIQSQRLDTTNPYAMRGTLTRAGRQVWVEQVPPVRVCSARVGEVDRQLLKQAKKRECANLISVVLVHESEGITCMAEEVAEGVSLSELLRERRTLDVQEAYLLLAGVDSALGQIEKAALPCRKLRLDDIYLLTGFAREDARTARLLMSPLNEWPNFSVTVRSHPSLASMSGRGTDPGVLLPLPPVDISAQTVWSGGWMAAAGRFLIGAETLSGKVDADALGREKEAVMKLLDDEVTKAREGGFTPRADFLARFAKIVQHYDAVKPIGTEPEIAPRAKPSRLVPVGKAGKKRGEPTVQTFAAGLTPTMGSDGAVEKPQVGFAEILFQSTGTQTPGGLSQVDEWEGEGEATEWLPESENVPLWLKAAVFLAGSMMLGGVLAHWSGEAFWQKEIVVPKAIPVYDDEPIPGVAVGQKSVPVKAPEPLPVTLPKESSSPTSGSPLSLSPPKKSSLRDLITEPPAAKK